MHWWYFCSRKYIYINNKRVDCLSDTSELQWRKCLCCYLHTSLSPLYLTCYPAAHETISAKAADDPLFSLCTAQHCLNATQLRHRVQTQTKLLGEDRLHQQCNFFGSSSKLKDRRLYQVNVHILYLQHWVERFMTSGARLYLSAEHWFFFFQLILLLLCFWPRPAPVRLRIWVSATAFNS